MVAIHVCIPHGLKYVLRKECQDKDLHETYKEYLNRRRGKNLTNIAIKKFFNFQRDLLNKTCPEGLDASFLCILLKRLFIDSVPAGEVECFDAEPPKKYNKILKKIQNFRDVRNDVMHNPEDKAVDPQTYYVIIKFLEEMLEEAAELYNIKDVEINAEKTDIRELYEQLNNHSEEEQRVMCAVSWLPEIGFKEAKEKAKQRLKEETLLFIGERIDRAAVFYELKVSVRSHSNVGNIISHTKILDNGAQIVIVSGVAGSGKSTLLRNLVLQFYKVSSQLTTSLQKFDLLVLMNLREKGKTTLSQVISDHFRNVCSKINVSNVVTAIFKLKTLFLVDGFDELNSDTSLMFQDLIRTLVGTECRVVITTRPHSLSDLTRRVTRYSLPKQEYEIETISTLEDQQQFLKRYESFVKRKPSTDTDLSTVFANMRQELRGLFTVPLLLILFCHLFWTYPQSISRWFSINDVVGKIYDLYKEHVLIKVADVAMPDKDLLIDDMFSVLEELALDSLQEDVLSFSKEEFDCIRRNCRRYSEKYGSNIDSHVVLSVVLKVHRSLNDETPMYSFQHKSVQENFACRYLIKQLSEHKEHKLKDILMGTNQSSARLVTKLWMEINKNCICRIVGIKEGKRGTINFLYFPLFLFLAELGYSLDELLAGLEFLSPNVE